MLQVDWITDADGRVLVDFIGRFEVLQEDFWAVCERLGVRARLPHVKSTNKRDYRSYYNDEAIETIARCFVRDIDRFGYEF